MEEDRHGIVSRGWRMAILVNQDNERTRYLNHKLRDWPIAENHKEG